MSVELSGEIAAIATAVLAVFAIVTAFYAARAFHSQAAQLAEQKEINAEARCRHHRLRIGNRVLYQRADVRGSPLKRPMPPAAAPSER